MGYSHYWKMPNKLINQEVLDDVKEIIERYESIVVTDRLKWTVPAK